MREVVLSTEEIHLELYAVRNKDGKWFRAKGYGGYGDSWVPDIKNAKIYAKPGPAKGQVTWWGNHFPEFGTPDLVRIVAGKIEVIDMTGHVKKASIRKQQEKLRAEANGLRMSIEGLQNRLKHVNQGREELKKLKERLAEVEAKMK